jgi:hypothetical protein
MHQNELQQPENLRKAQLKSLGLQNVILLEGVQSIKVLCFNTIVSPTVDLFHGWSLTKHYVLLLLPKVIHSILWTLSLI